MILIPHILVGAVIGAKIKYIGWVIILGLLSHFILDKIPHWDYGDKTIKKFLKNKSLKTLFIFFLKLFIDGSTGLLIVLIIIWQKNIIKPEYLIPIIVGILASIFPDFILGISFLSTNKFKKIAKAYKKFHEQILHCSTHILKPTLLGAGTEILVGILAILILLL